MDHVASYAPLVKCLGGFLGQNCEVVLHDLTVPEKTIIAIENGHVSGRSVGGVPADFLLKITKEHQQGEEKYVSSYRAVLQNGKTCRSSTYFIRDKRGKIVGALCINMDVGALEECQDILTKWITPTLQRTDDAKSSSMMHSLGSGLEVFEHLQENIEEVQAQLIDRVAKSFQIPLDRLSPPERQEIVRRLNECGLFLLKGGVSELSRRMKISEATIYRYLSKIKE